VIALNKSTQLKVKKLWLFWIIDQQTC